MVKCVRRAFAFESPSPGPVWERSNRLLHRTMGPEQFVTLFYGVLDVKKGELTYANAGHELPLVLRRGSGSPELLETTGRLLGLDSDSRYRQVCTPIDRGDTLVLYTDGFTDARRGNDFLQVEGLASLLDEFREGSAGDVDRLADLQVADIHRDLVREVVRLARYRQLRQLLLDDAPLSRHRGSVAGCQDRHRRGDPILHRNALQVQVQHAPRDRVTLYLLDHRGSPISADLQLDNATGSMPLEKLLERLAVQLDRRIRRRASVHDGRDLSLPA